MNLTIETKNTQIKSEIENAYNEAMESSNINGFVRSFNVNTEDNIIVGLSGSHVWISEKETGKRLAIITNLLN